MKNREWLIIVDYQNDFASPEWSLYVKNGELLLPYINNLINEIKQRSWIIISTQDWHPDNHNSFAKTHNLQDYSSLDWEMKWPIHCVKDRWWADFMDWLDVSKIDHKIYKWISKDVDSYSGFWWIELQTWKSLDEILKEYNIKLLNVVWLATDFCVWATVLDGLEKWYDVNFHKNWSAWVFPTVEYYQVYENMKSAWANFI